MANQIALFTGEQLPASLKDMTEEDRKAAAQIIGQSQGESGSGLPKLRVNYDAEFVPENDPEADPISLKRGWYKISVPQEDKWVTVFCKNPVVRLYLAFYRFSAYDQANNGNLVSSSLFQNWRDLVIDDGGNEIVAGGYKKRMLELYPELDGKLKCQHLMYGTVTFKDGKDMHGNAVDVTDVPFQMYIKGASYMAAESMKETIEQKDSLLPYNYITLSTGRETNGSVTYFPMQFDINKKEATEPDSDVYAEIARLASLEKDQTIEAFDKAVRKKPKNQEATAKAYYDAQAPVDMDAEIPF